MSLIVFCNKVIQTHTHIRVFTEEMWGNLFILIENHEKFKHADSNFNSNKLVRFPPYPIIKCKSKHHIQ